MPLTYYSEEGEPTTDFFAFLRAEVKTMERWLHWAEGGNQTLEAALERVAEGVSVDWQSNDIGEALDDIQGYANGVGSIAENVREYISARAALEKHNA